MKQTAIGTLVDDIIAFETNNGVYHHDPYIIAVALHNHPCYGHFSSEHHVCKTCSARVNCNNHVFTRMNQEARHFANPVPVVTGVQPATTTKFKPPNGSTQLNQIAAKQEPCGHCGMNIMIGDASVWVRKIQTQTKGKTESLILHVDCCEMGNK